VAAFVTGVKQKQPGTSAGPPEEEGFFMAIHALLKSASAIAFAIAAVTPAVAQEAPAPAGTEEQEAAPTTGIADIIVTATRRDTNLQTTPIAISAVDSSLIEQASPRDIGDLAVFVPNFSAATITGFNAASFSIRGVGQNNIIVYFEPPVAVLVDDFVVPSVQTQLLDTFDVDQVEVLRGPQGTLFGKNTTGGAVTVRTRRPQLDRFEVQGRVLGGSFGTFEAQGAVNIPIASTLALRAVIGHQQSEGYYRNGACYGPVVAFAPSKFAGAQGCGTGERLGGIDVWNARVKLLWEPVAGVSALFTYEHLRDRSDSIPTVNETPADPSFLFHLLGVGSTANRNDDPLRNAGISNRQTGLIGMGTGQRIDVDGLYLNLDVDTGFGTLTSVSGIRWQDSRLPNTYTGQAPVAPDGDVLSLFDANRSDDRRTWQQELRFASDLGGAFDFVAGGFYQNDETSFCVSQLLGFLDLASGPLPFGAWNDTPYILCNAQKAESTAVFAEGTFKITPELSFTAGGRYTWERKRWFGRQQAFIPQLGGGFDPTIAIGEAIEANVFDFPANVVEVRLRDNEPTWRASLGWQATPDIFAYATYSRGFKAGGFNDQIGSFAPFVNPDGSQDLAAFAEAAAATRPERANSYEVGVKTQSFDNRVRFNLTGFWVDYSDLQKQIVVPITVGGQPSQVTRFFNAASATVKGVEAEATVLPFEGFTLRGTLGYQNGKYNEYVTPIPAGYDLSSAPLDRLPDWQWSVDGTYAVPIGGHRLTFNANVSYVAENLFTQSITSPAENTFLNARTLVNASITLAQIDDKYYIRAIGRNLTDERYRTASQVVGGLWANSQFGPPRFYGIELGTRFGR
jgi:iron complex outermembrane recepter protein